MVALEDSIAAARGKTFRWIFNEAAMDKPWDSLLDWLKEGSGYYWMSGKAASGKSTLMKYLVHHPTTKSALEYWKGEAKEVLMPSFFFWNSGTSLQKTQTGLLRSMLFEMLSQRQDLSPNFFPELYDEELRQARMRTHSQVQSPSEDELKVATVKLLGLFPATYVSSSMALTNTAVIMRRSREFYGAWLCDPT